MDIYDAYNSSFNTDRATYLVNVVNVEKKVYGKFLIKLSRMFAVVGILAFIVFYLPSAVYAVSKKYEAISGKIAGNFDQNEGPFVEEVVKKKQYVPEFDPSLPLENTLKIPSAGIETRINEAMAENYEDAMRKGVWRVDVFGDPDSQDMPTILTAHRYGYLKWTVSYRLKNSFYNLPKSKKGDIVEIDWMQRKYTYEIYEESEGTEITDYSADLILYTCKSLNSTVKVYRYAKLLRV